MSLPPSDLIARRLDAVRRAIAGAGCDALAVTHRANVFYLSNFAGSGGALLVTATSLSLVTDSRYLTEARDLLASPSAPPGAALVPVENSYDETLAGLITERQPAVVGFEADDLTVARYEWLRQRVAGTRVDLRPLEGVVERPRAVKDSHEAAVLRDAGSRLAALVPRVVGLIREGVSEEDVAGAIDAAIRSSGFSRPAFDTIVGSGPNGALPHATAGERRLRQGDLVVLDFGGVRDGYCVDLTRTVCVGAASAEQRRVYAAVLAAQRAAVAAVRPGVVSGDIDAAARGVLEREGLGEAFGHATGHGLGIEVHEEPRICRQRRGVQAGPRAPGWTRIEPGMVFTIEPGAYLPGWGGVRIEDDVLVTDDGCEVLTPAARELIER